MSPADPFSRTHQLDDGTLEALVARFEERGKHHLFSAMLHEYVDAMRFADNATVLDLGCGSGLAARAVAQRPGYRGKVTGVDLSPYLVEVATRLAKEQGLADRIDFRTGDVHRLEFADGSFDALVAHTLLSHVADPGAVLEEAARVVRPGGMVGIFDGDYASLTFDHADSVKGKADDEALIGAIVTNPRVMRQMPRLLRAAGFELVTVFSHVLPETGTADFWAGGIEIYRKLMPQAGVLAVEEADAWAANLRRDSDAGVFFGSCNYYAYLAKRL